jgi:prophage maintenance system killer protein
LISRTRRCYRRVFIFRLERNGSAVAASQKEAYLAFHDLAAGKLSDDGLAQWLEANSEPVSK